MQSRGKRLFLVLQYVIAAVFGGLFVYAGALKAKDPAQFVMDIRSFHLLPDPWPTVTALVLPWVEILAGIGVACGILYHGSLVILNGSLLVFLGVIAQAWHRGLNITCGCFGESPESSDYLNLILRDVALLGLGLFLLFVSRSWRPMWRRSGASRSAEDLSVTT